MDRLEAQLRFLEEMDKLKDVLRQTILLNGSRRENDAEHCWHMAVAALVFESYAAQPVDMCRVLKICLLHDAVEIYAGDTYAYDTVAKMDQSSREMQAADNLFVLLPADQGVEFRGLWEEFESQRTPEAQYAKAMDCFMPMYHNYKTQGVQWKRFGVTSERVYERARTLQPGCPKLFAYALEMLDECVRKGYLPR